MPSLCSLSVLYNLEFIRPALQDPPGEEESKSIPDNQRERFFIIHRTYRVWEYSWWVPVLILRLPPFPREPLGAPPSASHGLATLLPWEGCRWRLCYLCMLFGAPRSQVQRASLEGAWH